MKTRLSAYWWCQIVGWSTYIAIYVFFYFTIRTKPSPNFFNVLLTDAVIGLLITHIMRICILKLKLINLSIQKQIVSMIVTALVFSFIYAAITVWADNTQGWEADQLKEYSFLNKTIRVSFGVSLFLLIWNLIYFTYHYVTRTRKEQMDTIRLESMVKELELKTIKSHINPHFIFNALNSIRALVDENPERARTAITELSNILRSSMKADSLETSPLERELNIVKDYLALEHIRFEDRLRIEYDIDEDTLDQQVPPMMLQTLVENAIKHGISKQIDGGVVKIISDFRQDHHELIVQNTGMLNSEINPEGFGIQSTYNRLKLLYGTRANFEIKNLNGNLVEAKVILPVQSL